MDPPGGRLPPPPSASTDDTSDDKDGEDEDGRKMVDFGDIEYADISLFYNLPSNAVVSIYCYCT